MSSLFIVIYGMGIGAALILMMQLALRHSCQGRAWLLLFLGLLAGGFTLELLLHQRFEPLETDVVTSMLLPFLPVTLWCYVEALTGQTHARNKKRHFLLSLLVTLCLLPLLFLDAPVRVWINNFEQGGTLDSLPKGSERLLLAALVGLFVFFLAWIGLLFSYGIAIVKRLQQHDHFIRNHFSNLEGMDRHRIRLLLSVTTGVIALELVDQIVVFADKQFLPEELEAAMRVVLLISFGLIGLSEPPLRLTDNNHEVPEELLVAPAYAKSSLSEEDCHRILEKLGRYMEDNMAWRDSDLNLSVLAAASGIRPNYISQALNTVAQHNFFSYVNQFRIIDACNLLLTTDDSVLTISTKVGFNAKSTFNSSFRRQTGQTPSQFRLNTKKASLS